MDTPFFKTTPGDNTSESPFQSFWMGGYECTDKLNAFGNRVDFIQLTGHLQRIANDYEDLQPFNIQTVREGIRWSQVEKRPYEYNWSEVAKMMQAGKEKNIQQIWDLCHFGFPDDLTPLHPMFARRFAAMCRSFVSFFRLLDSDSTLIVTPINEVSFLSWLGGEVRGTAPYCMNNGWEVKYALMRAYIEGIQAMKEIDPDIRILTTEPLVNIVPPLYATEDQIAEAALANEEQFQVLDILSGRICPELGGMPAYLDILGFNYYYNNQWVAKTGNFLPWVNSSGDARWRSLGYSLQQAYNRYGRPMAITETSHPGEDRPHWIRYVADECAEIIMQGIPLWGICLYPILDRPDWDNLDAWHRSGLWDSKLPGHEENERILYEPYAEELLMVQTLFEDVLTLPAYNATAI